MSKTVSLSTGAVLPLASSLLLGLGAGLASLPAQANNGVQLPAYGAKAMGMAGVSIALPQDAAASANNPAGMALLGNRFDADLTLLRAPIRTEVGSNHYADNAVVAVPTGGFNRVINADMSAGLSVFGQGIALDYGEPVFGSHDLKSSLQQVVLAPTVTWRLAPGHYVGFSPRLAYQRLEIAGLEGFGFASPGADKAYGGGFALGYQGALSERLSLGISYASPLWFQRLERYRGLLPDGRLNLPQQAGVGLAFKATPQLTLAADALWINWSGEHAYGNRLTEGGPLGASDGPGFGWRDQKILRFGASYELNEQWTLRAGASFSNHFIPSGEATFATLAPLAQYDHYSLGATYRLGNGWEVTGSYLYAVNDRLKGSGASQGITVGTDVNYLNLGIGYRF